MLNLTADEIQRILDKLDAAGDDPLARKLAAELAWHQEAAAAPTERDMIKALASLDDEALLTCWRGYKANRRDYHEALNSGRPVPENLLRWHLTAKTFRSALDKVATYRDMRLPS